MADNVSIADKNGSAVTVIADQVTDGVLGLGVVQYVKIMDGGIDSTTKLKVNADGSMSVSLSTKIAGEDLSNDWIKILSRGNRTVVGPYTSGTLANNATYATDGYVLPDEARKVTAFVVGSAGLVKVHLEVSEDYSHFGAITADQTTGLQTQAITADVCSSVVRAVVTNVSGANQTCQVWLTIRS